MLNRKPIWVRLNPFLNMVKSEIQGYWFGQFWVTPAKPNHALRAGRRIKRDASQAQRLAEENGEDGLRYILVLRNQDW